MQILLVDRYPLLRLGLKTCLNRIRNGLGVDEASTLAEAQAFLDKKHYHLVVLSLNLPDSTGLDTVTAVLARPVPPDVAICTGLGDEYPQGALLETAARALIRKDWSLERIADVLSFLLRGIDSGERVANGPTPEDDNHLSPVIASLSPRRREVLELLCRGYRNKEIARALHLEENTVKVHVRYIMRRLGATSRTQAALMGRSAFGESSDPNRGLASKDC